jgi:hypothetical protein
MVHEHLLQVTDLRNERGRSTAYSNQLYTAAPVGRAVGCGPPIATAAVLAVPVRPGARSSVATSPGAAALERLADRVGVPSIAPTTLTRSPSLRHRAGSAVVVVALDLDVLPAAVAVWWCAGAAPLDLDVLAELVAIALVAAGVAEHVTRAPARPGALAVVAELAVAGVAGSWSPS